MWHISFPSALLLELLPRVGTPISPPPTWLAHEPLAPFRSELEQASIQAGYDVSSRSVVEAEELVPLAAQLSDRH